MGYIVTAVGMAMILVGKSSDDSRLTHWGAVVGVIGLVVAITAGRRAARRSGVSS